MRGKVKYVSRNEWYSECASDHHRGDVHPLRHTNTYAVLYPDKDGNEIEVEIDEDEIRDCFGCQRITRNIISQLNDALHNEWIEFSYDEYEDEYCLDDNLGDYLW